LSIGKFYLLLLVYEPEAPLLNPLVGGWRRQGWLSAVSFLHSWDKRGNI